MSRPDPCFPSRIEESVQAASPASNFIEIRAIQSSNNSGLENGACLGVKNIGIGVGRDADEGGNSQSSVRENRMHGLMREGRREPVFYSTFFFFFSAIAAGQTIRL